MSLARFRERGKGQTAMEWFSRAKAREKARRTVSACRTSLGECEGGALNDAVTSLLTAIEELCDVSEDQDHEIARLRRLER